MGIATDLVDFFKVDSRQDLPGGIAPNMVNLSLGIDSAQQGFVKKSVKDFFNYSNNREKFDLIETLLVIQRLTEKGILIHSGVHPEISPPLGMFYFSSSFGSELAEYGAYDFITLGFPEIRSHFAKSVQAVVVVKENEYPDIGSTFLLHSYPMFVTARHCVENMREVKITGWDATNTPLYKLWFPVDERVDLAILQFHKNPLPQVPGFLLQESRILDDVLTMGYPPIPGFDSVLVAERGQVSGHLKSTTGQVVAEEQSYLDQQIYLLISARVKGGNSGGPVIGNYGCVTGVVTQLPADAEGRADVLGYAAAIPASKLDEIVNACVTGDACLVQEIGFQPTDEGFSTFEVREEGYTPH